MRFTRFRPKNSLKPRLEAGETGTPFDADVARWAISIGLAALPTIVNFWVVPIAGGRVLFLPYVPAIMLAGFLAGVAPGVLVLALSIAAIDFFWIAPAWTFTIGRRSDWLALFLCWITGAGVLGLSVAARLLLIRARSMRKRLHEALKVARETQERLQEADRRKDEFLATLAHELRNPMAPIRYAAAALNTGVSDSTLQHARTVIERQSAQMTRLLDDLLDLSRITRDVIELKRARVDLGNLIKEVTEFAQPLLGQLRHRLTLSFPAVPLVVSGDPARLLQIFGNLLDNAAKYTPAGGHIEISAESLSDQAVVRIRDNGIGLATEMLPRVFDLFTQVRQPLQTGGLGIGLTVVKRLVELHGGSIEATSEGLNRGAQFTLRLPLTRSLQPHQGEAPPSGNIVPLFDMERRVLIVDDNQDATEALAILLRGHGFHVTVAFGGEAALRAYAEVRPAVILLDMGLPDMSGTDVARQIRNRTDGNEVRIIAITGWGQEADRRRTRAAGIDLHLVKPVDPNELLELLREHMAKQTPGRLPRLFGPK
ncbi:MAG TPA: ATP-binding protein [Steroidobacteraceae bacterium]|jgi:signal transduction histidine kinase/ActR/RegA family two-component response regulator|nr:ATP-binding protein [Steroidobacteraceae bacterium]